jgi:hypothetical protein
VSTGPATSTHHVIMSTRTKRAQSACGSLSERLLAQQPRSKSLLERLAGRFDASHRDGAFATIEQGLCRACRVRVAATELQRARLGEFVNCPCCSRFLYVAADGPRPGERETP